MEGTAAAMLAHRRSLRAAGDFKSADELRGKLYALHGITVDDAGSGSWVRWNMPHLPASGCLAWVQRRGNMKPGERPGKHCGRDRVSEYYCASHQTEHAGRVPCPRVHSHTIALSRLSGHLKVCSGVPSLATIEPTSAPYLEPGANSGERGAPPERLDQVSQCHDRVSQCHDQVSQCHDALLPPDVSPGEIAAAMNDMALLSALAMRVTGVLADLGLCARAIRPEAIGDNPRDTVLLQELCLAPLPHSNGIDLFPAADQPAALAAVAAGGTRRAKNSARDVEQ
eukprot:TRINITY_DN17026_c0_g1_i1.p1 TRINITY_DN17026_c0_g1~~TRINITY_DN17026_c0_g1_i1.p1  ORF type:complete len:283 (+),score=50.08 TRINITY_DN17026_c0_g1_i1:136-984(+)